MFARWDPAPLQAGYRSSQSMNTSEIIAKFLSQAGIGQVFGYPGETNVELIEGLRRIGIDFILASREGTAGLMAQAYGMVTGRPGVCISTLGPGATNLVNAVANAYLDRAPMLAFSGQMDTQKAPYFTHQVIDHNRLFAPVAKWATELQADNVATVMRKAYRVAAAERPGPVHITLRADVVSAAAEDVDTELPPVSLAAHHLQVIARDGCDDPIKAISNAKRPVLLFGNAAARAQAGSHITKLAEHIGCPIIASPMAKGTVAEDHALFAGVLDMACFKLLWDLLTAADLILCVGFDAVELISPWIPKAPVVHIDTVPNTDQVYAAPFELVGPVREILSELQRQLPAGERWTEKEVAAHRTALRDQYFSGRVAGKLNPSDVVDVVRGAAGRNAVATVDVGSHKLLVGQGWATYRPQGMLMSNGLSSMGFALPAAIAAQLLLPDTQVVCLTGDGGLAMTQAELRLASTLKLGIRVIVFCDNSLNRIELRQMQSNYPSTGTRIAPTDVAKLAESMDCDGVMVDRADELERVLSEARNESRPLVIGARIDPSQYRSHY